MIKSLFLIMLFYSVSAFAGGYQSSDKGIAHFEFTHTKQESDKIKSIHVFPSKEIVEIFINEGVDFQNLTQWDNKKNIPESDEEILNFVLSTNYESVIELIKRDLKNALSGGDFEYAYLSLGDRIFVMHLYYK